MGTPRVAWWLGLAIATSGCRQVLGIESATAGDASPKLDARTGDAFDPCFVDGFDVCSLPLADDLVLAGPIDTDADQRCIQIAQAGMAVLCVIHGHNVSISGDVFVTGRQPLAIVADLMLTVDAKLDLSSTSSQLGAGANDPSCQTGAAPLANSNGAAGGAGGSFQGAGGAGGAGQLALLGGIAGMALPVPTTIRGGCAGQQGAAQAPGSGGRAGSSGGAVWLVARGTILVDKLASVVASGNGGGGGGGTADGGGGGGGTGGLVRMSSSVIQLAGTTTANGGGGGGGGNGAMGADGKDGQAGTSAAVGGAGGPLSGGDGGQGSDLNSNTGAAGSAATDGGGGGGGAGYILLHGTTMIDQTAVVSPQPIIR